MIDLFLFLARQLSSSIWNTSNSGVKSSWTSLYPFVTFCPFFQLKSIASPRRPKDERDTKSCERGTKEKEHGDSSSSPPASPPRVSPMQKVHQLERNMAFMRDQHRQMLAALQEEVDTLKRRNQGGNYNRRMSKNSTGWSIWCRKNFCWHGIMSFVIKLGRII